MMGLLFFVFIMFDPKLLYAQNSDIQTLEVTLKNQSHEWIKAVVTKNREALEARMAESFFMIDVDGRTVDKQSFIKNVTSVDLVIEPYNFEDFNIRIYGDTAIINATNKMRGTYQGNPFTRYYRYTDVFVREGDVWRVVSVQATIIR